MTPLPYRITEQDEARNRALQTLRRAELLRRDPRTVALLLAMAAYGRRRHTHNEPPPTAA